MSVGEDARPGQPSTSTNDDHVKRDHAVIRGSHRLTVREVANEVGISIGSCHQIFTEKLHMCRVSAKFVLIWQNIRHTFCPIHPNLQT
jgi:AraC-like DNA-binding protein